MVQLKEDFVEFRFCSKFSLLYRMKYSYLIQIICPQLYGYIYLYLILIIFKQLYSFKSVFLLNDNCSHLFVYSYTEPNWYYHFRPQIWTNLFVLVKHKQAWERHESIFLLYEYIVDQNGFFNLSKTTNFEEEKVCIKNYRVSHSARSKDNSCNSNKQ